MTFQQFFSLKEDFLYSHVIYSGAVTTEEVMMGIGFIVVMSFITLYGYLLYEPVLFQEIEGIIDRGSRQGGVHPPEGLVDLFGCEMCWVVLEELQDR